LFAFVLELAQLGGFFFAAPSEPGFLQLQVTELFFVDHEGVELDEGGTQRGLVFLEEIGKFEVAFGEDRHLESGNASEAPGNGGDGLDETALLCAAGTEFLFVHGDVALVVGDIGGGKQHGGAGEPGVDSVERGGVLVSLRLAENRGFGSGSGFRGECILACGLARLFLVCAPARGG